MKQIRNNTWDVINTKKNHKRSLIDLSGRILTTMNTGQVIPLHCEELIPGDYINLNIKSMLRQTTLLTPTMDTAKIDIHTYQVNWRTIWEDTAKFFGENTSKWTNKDIPPIPTIKSPTNGWDTGTIADYLGIPPGIKTEVNALIFRAYTKIINDWYRDQNLQDEAMLNTTSGINTGSNGNEYIKDLEKGGKPFTASKLPDYFTSGLPEPQKGNAIVLNLGGKANVEGQIQVGTTLDAMGDLDLTEQYFQPLKFGNTLGTDIGIQKNLAIYEAQEGLDKHYDTFATDMEAGQIPTTDKKMAPTNLIGNTLYNQKNSNYKLIADLSQATGISINQLRESIVMQQMLELDARAGTRYTEYLAAHFGIINDDARLQRSEYLGGFSQELNTIQVPQTSATTNESPQANLTAFGETRINENGIIKKTIMEHSYLIIVGIIRYKHTYQQGLHPMWSIKNKLDIYDPLFEGLGERPIYNKEIFLQGKEEDDEIFAFQEAYARYKNGINRTSGLMRSGIEGSLDVNHYGDHYTKLPKLDSEWIKEDAENIDRTLAIKSTGKNGQPQFYGDFYINLMIERPIPAINIPGIDKI